MIDIKELLDLLTDVRKIVDSQEYDSHRECNCVAVKEVEVIERKLFNMFSNHIINKQAELKREEIALASNIIESRGDNK